nr:putative ribonuclease h protein [Quercus suber]
MLWRATKDALPTRANLTRRKVLTNPTCHVCDAEPESTLHALWSCPKLKEVWTVHFESLQNETSGSSNFLDVFNTCLEKSHHSDLFAMLADQIWFRRNKLRVGEEAVDLKQLNSRARDALHDFQLASATSPNPPPVRSPTKWKPPPSAWVKSNFDGAVFMERAEAGLGSIIRNDCGLVMAASTQIIPLPTTVEMVEVLAARRALIFAKELGFDQVILEGDYEIAIKAMKSDDYSAAAFGHIVFDIKALSTQFRCVIFQHTRRQGNMVAHSLARSACNFPHFCTWMEEVPVSSFAVYSAEIINTT